MARCYVTNLLPILKTYNLSPRIRRTRLSFDFKVGRSHQTSSTAGNFYYFNAKMGKWDERVGVEHELADAMTSKKSCARVSDWSISIYNLVLYIYFPA